MARFNIKTILLLAVALLAMVSADNRSFRKLRKLEGDVPEGKDGESDDEPKDVMITRSKGKGGAADEIDVDIKLKSCKEGSEECKTIKDDADDVEDVSLAMFSSLMAEEMVSALEKDEDDKDGRMLESDERELRGDCRRFLICKYYRYCRKGKCYIIRRCKYVWRCSV